MNKKDDVLTGPVLMLVLLVGLIVYFYLVGLCPWWMW